MSYAIDIMVDDDECVDLGSFFSTIFGDLAYILGCHNGQLSSLLDRKICEGATAEVLRAFQVSGTNLSNQCRELGELVKSLPNDFLTSVDEADGTYY